MLFGFVFFLKGSILRETYEGLLQNSTFETTVIPSKLLYWCGCRFLCGLACPSLCATAVLVPWTQKVINLQLLFL